MHTPLIIIRGGGDIASGVAQRFFRAGYRILILETNIPTAIRRTVALSEAVFEGFAQVEDVLCRLVFSTEEMAHCHENGEVPLMVDPQGECIQALRPGCVVDAILAKKNLGTHMGMAPITIALGPGFTAGEHVHAVIETMRGHNLGRVILQGAAQPNTGIPAQVNGRGSLRVVHTTQGGTLRRIKDIGDVVNEGEPLFYIGTDFTLAPMHGLLRGMLRDASQVHKGMKVADIDPRTHIDVHTISDKARCVGGGALEAYLYLSRFLQPAPQEQKKQARGRPKKTRSE